VNTRRPPNNAARWFPVAAAAGLLAAVVGVGIVSGGGGGDGAPSETSAGTVVPVDTPLATVPIETVSADDQIVTESTDVATPKTPIDRTLGDGVVGDDVKMVQQRLKDLAFDPGPVDGQFGTLTKQAVWAFEKLVMDVPDRRPPARSRRRCGTGCRTRSRSSRAVPPAASPTTSRSTCPSR
jgi:peptidoglycan hydrolase-like protein with peptidoglycan-binding domain